MKINEKLYIKIGAGVRNSAFTSGSCLYYKIGNIVILSIADLYGNTEAFEGTVFSGLPRATSSRPVFILRSYQDFGQTRLRIQENGTTTTHYSNVPKATNANQFYGFCIYETTD